MSLGQVAALHGTAGHSPDTHLEPDSICQLQWITHTQFCIRQLLCFCRSLGMFTMHFSMVLLLVMFPSLRPPPGGAGPIALMLQHEWSYVFMYVNCHGCNAPLCV